MSWIRAGKVTLVDAFAAIDRGEAWLHQMDIGVYTFAHQRNHDPRRKRKLLLHRREIERLSGKIREKGSTLVPLSLYEKKGRVKAELALVHGKQSWDKREDAKNCLINQRSKIYPDWYAQADTKNELGIAREDWADLMANSTSNHKENWACVMVSKEKDWADSTELDAHAPIFYRLLHAQWVKNKSWPKACLPAIKSLMGATEFRNCAAN